MALTGKPTKTDPTPTIASTFTRPGKTIRKATSIRIRLDLLQAAKVCAPRICGGEPTSTASPKAGRACSPLTRG